MTVYERNSGVRRYVCRIIHKGRSYNKAFKTFDEAKEHEAKLRAEFAQRRIPSDELLSELQEAAMDRESIAAVLLECGRLDWAKSQGQLNLAVRACSCLDITAHPASVTMERLDAMVSTLQESGKANGTIRNMLSCVSVMLKRAHRMRLIQELPLMPEARTLPLPESRDLVLDDAWVLQVIDELEDHTQKDLVYFLWKVGCRVEEAISLPWSRVSFQRKRITFIKTKTTRPRQIPISDDIEELLLKCAERDRRGPFMKTTYNTFYYQYKQKIGSAVSRAVMRLQLDPIVEEQWCIHTLRHTCCSNLALHGASAVQIQQWAGHTNLSTSQRYIHASAIDLEELAETSMPSSLPWCIHMERNHV